MTAFVVDRKRQRIFKWISICLPFFFFVLLEGILRLFNYGNDPSLFIAVKNKPGFVQTNPYVSSRFFNNQQDAPTSYTQIFPAKKSDSSFRIFVLGESSALGFPYQHRGSFPRMLEYRLQKTFPDKQIEMINLAITAVSSYTLLAFTDEILSMQPDAVLIYAGHNEYYGAMGVGSGHRVGLNRNIVNTVIWLRQSKVVQLVLNSVAGIREAFSRKAGKEEPGMMSKMAGEQEILLGSKLYQQGLRQFEKNMSELLNAYHKHHVPVYFSNLVSNERGQKPFISKLQPATDSTRFLPLFNKAKAAIGKGDTTQALSLAMQAFDIDSTYAANDFLLGDIYFFRNEFNKAKVFYDRSKESDGLRFRAPEAINAIIVSLSKQYDNIHFVDSKKLFDSAADHRILGNGLFTDHLHPNINGYYLISDAFYRSLKNSRVIGDWSGANDAKSVRPELPVSAVDSAYGSLVVMFMKEEWPFFEPAVYDKNKPKTYPEHLAVSMFLKQINWEMAMDSLYKFDMDNRNYAGAIKTAKELMLERPYQWKFPATVGQLYTGLKEYNQALWYLKRSFQDSNTVDIARKIVFNQLQLDSLEQVFPYLAYVSNNQPSDIMSIKLTNKVREILTLKKQVKTNPQDLAALKKLAGYYIYLRNKDVAKLYIDKAMSLAPKDSLVLALAGGLRKLESGGIPEEN